MQEIPNSTLFKKLQILGLLLSFFLSAAQELPPVVNYGPNQYSAGNQNWMIDRGESRNLYFANSNGLLEYNGERWNLYPVPNKTIVRSLKVVGDRIYTGAYMEVGFWEANELGELEYTSLVSKFENIKDGEQFWDIEYVDDIIIFRSFAGIYFYNPQKESLQMLDTPQGKPVSAIYKFEGELYYQLVGNGLYKLENGVSIEVIPFSVLKDRNVIHLYNKTENGFSLIIGNAEFYKWNGKELEAFNITLSDKLGRPNVLDVVNLTSGNIVLGTVGKGIIEISPDGKILNNFDQSNILMNNTVLDLFLDRSGNVWAGLDYGISSIELSSTFKSFQDNRGEIGSVYTSLKIGADLYLGTNQGLYIKNENSSKFELIQGTNGQVWFLDVFEGKILAGHDKGTFLIEGTTASKISNRLGTWVVKPFFDDIYIQGHYNGISFLKKTQGSLVSLPLLRNFPHSSKFIEVDRDKTIWVGNEHKGVFRMLLNDSLTQVNHIKNYKFENESGVTSSIFKYADSLYYSSKNHIYQYDRKEDRFRANNNVNRLTASHDRISGKMIAGGDGLLWGFTEDGIFYVEPSRLSKDYESNFIFLNQDFRNVALGYENIRELENDTYLLGIGNGYITFNKNQTHRNYEGVEVTIDGIAISAIDSSSVKVDKNSSGEFKFASNNINFQYSAPVHEKFLNPYYSYRLLGLSDKWSDWNRNSEVSFKNLDYGDYTFEVKARIGEHITETSHYSFTINRPLTLSLPALIGYTIIFTLILFGVHLYNKKHHRKKLEENARSLKMKNLEAEKEIIRLRNEKLEQDMVNKNRELAVSTMSLIKKNEFLTAIKDKLKDSDNNNQVRSVIRTINKDISEEDNWKFFKKAFSNADKDFFQKVKDAHPELTTNDLKLCAYLRLNLSSKEIAPLLNISVKSVEIKRYRLRKKMNLDRETNLTEYILSL
ncbi:triple tyrosine motif-containing protein [Christiangramia aquimixticola]|uniref:triple tyrosine motif-containing protein n=1 Tax=Christiangramia aquimixticola TaxID=1697558 RepID=UPI003AA8340F